MRFILLASILGALAQNKIMLAPDDNTGGGGTRRDPFADQDRQRERQKALAEQTLADQRARQAAALAAETDTELTTVEHSGKRTGEIDKPDDIEDNKVGEGYKTEEVQTTEVTRQTLDGEQVVDVRVTNPNPDMTAAAAMAANPEGSTADPRLAAGATLPGTRAQQNDTRQVAKDSGGTDPAADKSSTTKEGDVALQKGKTGKVSDHGKDNGPGHTTV